MGRGPKKGLKRSGLAVTQYCDAIGWRPQAIWMAGVGLQCKEVDIFYEQWPEVQLIGFEPHPNVFSGIKEDFHGELYPYALSSAPGNKVLYNRQLHKNGSSLYKRKDGTATEEHVIETRTLNNYLGLLAEKGYPDSLLWLDAEGSEYEILKGGITFIETCVSAVNIEMTGRPEHEGWSSPEKVHGLLTDLGFTAVWIHSIRVPLCQYDCIYLKNEKVDNTMRIWG